MWGKKFVAGTCNKYNKKRAEKSGDDKHKEVVGGSSIKLRLSSFNRSLDYL